MKKAMVVATQRTNANGEQEIKFSLHILVIADSDGFYAQALELDYGAAGRTFEEAKENFVRGFLGTVNANVERFGDFTRMFKHHAPKEYWLLWDKIQSQAAQSAAEPASPFALTFVPVPKQHQAQAAC